MFVFLFLCRAGAVAPCALSKCSVADSPGSCSVVPQGPTEDRSSPSAATPYVQNSDMFKDGQVIHDWARILILCPVWVPTCYKGVHVCACVCMHVEARV